MNIYQEQSKKSQISSRAANDDLWLADLPNDLEAMSLSSDNIPTRTLSELAGIREKTHGHAKSHSHKHNDVGF